MRYNNEVMPVVMPFDSEVIYTEKDIVFAIPGKSSSVMAICTKEHAGSFSTDYFEFIQTEAYSSAIRSLFDFKNASNDRLIKSGALKEILDYYYGEGFNGNGLKEFLANRTDLDSLKRNGRWQLKADFTYNNLALQLSSDHYLSWFENTLVGNFKIQSQILISKTLDISAALRFFNGSKWSRWVIYDSNVASTSFAKFWETNITQINNLINYVNSLINSLNDSVVSIIHSSTFSNISTWTINVTSFVNGYFNVILTTNTGVQYSTSFCFEDMQYMKYASISRMKLVSNDSACLFYLVNSSNVFTIETSTSLTDSGSVRVIKLPLKVAENGI